MGMICQLQQTKKMPADRCSMYICIEELGDDGVKAVVAAAEFFNIQAKAGGQRGAKVMADEHLLNEQRFFNSPLYDLRF